MHRSHRAVGVLLGAVLLGTAIGGSPAAQAAPPTVLSAGHVDGPGIAFEDGQFDLHVHAEDLEAEFAPGDAILEVLPGAETIVPNDPQFAFLGTVGAPTWILPQVEDPNLLFLGIGAEEIAPGTFLSDEMQLSIQSVTGPGSLAAFTSGVFGEPTVVFDSDLALPQSTTVAAGDHTHVNWAFSAPGVYTVEWQVDAVLPDESPVSSGPVAYTYVVSADGPCHAGAPSANVGDVVVSEDDAGAARVAKFAVTLSAASLVDVTVGYQVTGGTPKALKFKAGTTSKYVTAKVTPDVVLDGDATITATLTSVDAGYVLGRSVGSATVVDDDPGASARLSAGDVSACEGDSGKQTKVSVPITLSEPAGGTVTVQYTLAEGTAGATTDFRTFANPKTITFKPGQVRKFVVVTIERDTVHEIDETVDVVLSNVSGATIVDDRGVVTILDDDAS